MKKPYRIKKNEEFGKIIALKQTMKSPSFFMHYNKRAEEHCRVGISVTKKLGNAVERNRMKRQVRAMLDEVLDFENFPYDLIFIVRKSYKERSFSRNKNDLETLLKKAII